MTLFRHHQQQQQQHPQHQFAQDAMSSSSDTKSPQRRLLGVRRDTSHGSATSSAAAAERRTQQQQQQQQQQPRVPKVTSAAVASLSTTARHQDDIDNAPILSPASPGTPPKKTWERQYRNFLNRKKTTGQEAASAAAFEQQQQQQLDHSNHRHNHNIHHHHHRNNNNNNNNTTPPKSLPIPQPQHQQRAASATLLGRNTNTGSTAAMLKNNNNNNGAAAVVVKEEGSVRGGKLFGHMFRKESSSNGNHSGGAPLLTPPVRRRVKSLSADELGGTMRRGVEKGQAISPRGTNNNNNNTYNLDKAHHQSIRNVSVSASSLQMLSGLQQAAAAPPPMLRPRISTEEENGSGFGGFSGTGSLMMDTDSYGSTYSQQQQQEGFWGMHGGRRLGEFGEFQPNFPPQIFAPDIDVASSSNHGNNTDLDLALAMQQSSSLLDTSSSAIKKAFTEFHNSADTGADSVSAFLGEDSSLRGGRTFLEETKKVRRGSNGAGGGGGGGGGMMTTKTQNHFIMPKVVEGVSHDSAIVNERVLRAFIGSDQWQSGRRYLIGPAALFASHASVASAMKQEMTRLEHANDDDSRFGTIVLGDCFLTYGGVQKNGGGDQGWSSSCLVLRQNYLLEYDADMQTTKPRGYAHLQYSVAYAHSHFSDVIELHFYGSPCAKTDKRVLLIRVQDPTKMEQWRKFLNRAASLTIEDVYEIQVGMLGKGQYSTVHKATRRGDTEEVAVKLFDKNQFWRLVAKGVERADTLMRECSVQATLTNQRNELTSFIHLRGFLETADHVILEMELLDGTDLFKHISSKGVLPEREAARILADILGVVVAMNEAGLSHRDIKPANIMMCGQNGDAKIKLGDFGMSTFVGGDGLVHGRCGTPGYVAPEIFTAGLHGGYGNKVDVFSAGVTLYVMLCGYEPFYGTSDEELIEANQKAELDFPKEEWSSVSREAISLLHAMMAVDPKKRPSAKDVLSDPWIRSHVSVGDLANPSPPGVQPNDADSCMIL